MFPDPFDIQYLRAGHIVQRLEEGDSPQDLLNALVVATKPSDFEQTMFSLKVLLDAGAKIATGEKDCALERLVSYKSIAQDLLFSKLIIDMMSEPGEVPLHVIARRSPQSLWQWLSRVIEPDRYPGLAGTDIHGRTVSHYLWDPDGQLVKLANDVAALSEEERSEDNACVRAWMDTLETVWQAQGLLDGHGIGMDKKDHNGITAMDLCLARIKDGHAIFLPDIKICDKVQSCLQSIEMDKATPLAPKPISGYRF